jgi:hypothetical protein
LARKMATETNTARKTNRRGAPRVTLVSGAVAFGGEIASVRIVARSSLALIGNASAGHFEFEEEVDSRRFRSGD